MEFRNNIFNPIYESVDKIIPDINPKCGQMHWPCPDNSKQIRQCKSDGIGESFINPKGVLLE